MGESLVMDTQRTGAGRGDLRQKDRSNDEITVNKIEGVQRGGSHSRGRRAERGSSYILTRGVHKGEVGGNGRESLTFREGEGSKAMKCQLFCPSQLHE